MLLLTKYTVLYKENEICCIILLSLPSRERGLKFEDDTKVYCPYSTVCGFDTEIPGYEFRRLKNFADEELWNAFAKEVE